MKRSVFLYKVAIICAMVFMVGCNSDSITDNTVDTIIEETIVEKRGPIIEENRKMNILIVYVKGTSEVEKRKIRFKYIKTGLLLNWEKCIIKDNDDVETWEVDPVVYFASDPVADLPAENEAMEKAVLYQVCKDYRRK